MNKTCRRSLWRISSKTSQPEKGVIGILAFGVANLMSKVVKLWQFLNDDTEILKLREEILINSVAIKNLVSVDDDYLIFLAFQEMIIGDLVYAAKSVARLGKQCSDPVYHRLEEFFVDPLNNYVECCGWKYRWKKMERKVKKMEKFMSLMLQFTQEQELLSELEQTLRRMKANPLLDKCKLYEFRKKVTRQRQELRTIRDLSPWNRSYDYIVRLLARSIFTILDRITFMLEGKRSSLVCRSHSLSHVHPSEPHLANFLHSKKKGLNHIANSADDKGVKFMMSESHGIYEIVADSYSRHGRIDALPSTVGSAALTLHYANVVLQVEKLAKSPRQLLGAEARDNLYNMLPTAIRDALRDKLMKPSAAVVYPDASVSKMLEWLAPIARNTVNWYSDRSIEQHVVCGKNVFLVHTFYFADQGKAEAAITELLVALNYLYRQGRN